jgi:hypothetical protein
MIALLCVCQKRTQQHTKAANICSASSREHCQMRPEIGTKSIIPPKSSSFFGSLSLSLVVATLINQPFPAFSLPARR